MAEERIMTLHPAGKQGTNIRKARYDQMRNEIVAALTAEPEQTFSGLNDVVGKRLEGNFDGSLGWYFTTVKLDLEARGAIERVPNTSPQKLRLTAWILRDDFANRLNNLQNRLIKITKKP